MLLKRQFLFLWGLILFLLGFIQAPLQAQVDPSWRQLKFVPTAVTSTLSTDMENPYSWPSFQIILHEQQGEVLAPAVIPTALIERLDKIFVLPEASVLQRVKGPNGDQWGLEIPGGTLLRKENLLLLEALRHDFIKCLDALSERETELVKNVLYNLGESMTVVGEVRISEETTAAVKKMEELYRLNRCTEGGLQVPDFTQKLLDRLLTRLLSGQDPSAAISDQDLLALVEIFNQLLFSPEGLWVRVSTDRIQQELSDKLQLTAKTDKLDWLDRSYAGFVDFVVATRGPTGLSKDDYLTLAEACGVNDVWAIFSDFHVNECRQQQKLQFVELQQGESKGLLMLPGPAILASGLGGS